MPKGRTLPYLDELTFIVVPRTQDAQVIRFQAGDAQIISSLSADNYAVLEPEQKARRFKLYNAGPGLEYNFLMFNLNDDTEGRCRRLRANKSAFRDVHFRQAVSAALDRSGIVRLVYHNRGAAIATHVSPGNKAWFNSAIPAPARSLPQSPRAIAVSGVSTGHRTTLCSTQAASRWNSPSWWDSGPMPSAVEIATLLQDDLEQIGDCGPTWCRWSHAPPMTALLDAHEVMKRLCSRTGQRRC